MRRFSFDFASHKWAIFFCAISSLGALCYGYDQIYYTGVLGMTPFIELYGQTTTSTGLPALTTTFTSLTASIIYVGELCGALMAAPINDRWGRKGVFLCASLCIIAGGLVQVSDQGIEGVIVAGRILIGLGIGQFTVTCVLYIGEVAPRAIRGPALMMFQLLQSCSQLVCSGITQGTSSLKTGASFRIPMGGLCVLPLMMLLGLWFLPESPIWLVRKGRKEKAALALRKIHNGDDDYNPQHELEDLEEIVRVERISEETSSWSSLFHDPIERRKVLYSAGAMIAQQINGIQFFYSYGVIFAESIGMSNPFTVSLITNVLQVIACFVSVIFGNRIGRRPNLLTTTGTMFVAYIIIGGLGSHWPELPHSFATAIVVISYVVICAFNFGLGPLAYTVASEAASGRNRSKILSTTIVTFFFTVWVISFTSPYIYYDAQLGPMLGFVYAGSTCITLAYIWYCVGETAGRSIQEVELFFQRKVPVREWSSYQFSDDTTQLESRQAVGRHSMKGPEIVEVEGKV